MRLNKFLVLGMSMMMAMVMSVGCNPQVKHVANELDRENPEKEELVEEREQGVKGDKVLTMAVGAELNTLYPLNMDQQNYVATKLCYEGLVNYENGEVVPSLSESYSFSEDGCDLTFKLRKGIAFHDGTPFNAEAVKIAFEFAKSNPNFGGIKAVANLESVEVVDEYTAVFHYPTPYYAYLADFCYPEAMILVSPKVIEKDNYQTMKGVVGTGPYIYKEIVEGEYVRFEKNPAYWGEKGYYDEIIVKYIPEAASRMLALKSGEIDMIYGEALLSWDDYEQATTMKGIKGEIADFNSETRNIVLNASSEPLMDLKVREAIAYGIHKEALASGLSYGHEEVANRLFVPGIPYTDCRMDIERTYDVEKAKALLDDAGWQMNTQTGIREKDGAELSLDFTYDQAEVMNKQIATAIKSQLKEIGIDVNTVPQEMYTWWKEGVAGNYDLTIWNTEQPYTAPHNFFTPMLDHSPHTPSLKGIEGSAGFNELIKEFQTTNNEERVTAIFDELLNFDNNYVLDIPLTYTKDMIVYNTDKIKDYTFTSTPMFFDSRYLEPVSEK